MTLIPSQHTISGQPLACYNIHILVIQCQNLLKCSFFCGFSFDILPIQCRHFNLCMKEFGSKIFFLTKKLRELRLFVANNGFHICIDSTLMG